MSTALDITIDIKLSRTVLKMYNNSRKNHESNEISYTELIHDAFYNFEAFELSSDSLWTYLSHIWGNLFAIRTRSLPYKILLKFSNTKYKPDLTKMEYICSQIPIDLEIILSQATFAHKNCFDSDQCSRALSYSHSNVSRSLHFSLRRFAIISGVAPGKKYTKGICEQYTV